MTGFMEFEAPILDSGRDSSVYHSISNLEIDTDDSLPIVPVGDHKYVGFKWFSNTGDFEFEMEFYSAAEDGFLMGVEKFEVRQAQELSLSVPASGPYMLVDIHPNAANSFYSFQAWGMASPWIWPGEPDGSVLISAHNVNVNAGATRTDAVTRIWPGPATWHIKSTATSWQAFIDYIDKAGATRVMDWVNNLTPQNERAIYLPRGPVQIRSTNLDGVARSFFVYLIADPRCR